MTLLNLILILPSVFWTMANLCTCGRKLPHTTPCKMGQLRAAPQAPVASKPMRSRRQQQWWLGWRGDGKWHPAGAMEEAGVMVTGWKSNM